MNKLVLEEQALSFRLSDVYKWAFGYCITCKNTGVYQVSNGADDFDWSACECGLKPLYKSREKYLELTI